MIPPRPRLGGDVERNPVQAVVSAVTVRGPWDVPNISTLAGRSAKMPTVTTPFI
jgi:hypothetical protein